VFQGQQKSTQEELQEVTTLQGEEELTISACHQIHNTTSDIEAEYRDTLICMELNTKLL
jgi:hypothetical protein